MRKSLLLCLIAFAASNAEAKPVTYQCGKYVVEADYENSSAVYHSLCGDTALTQTKAASGMKFNGRKDEGKSYTLWNKGGKVLFYVNEKPYACRLK